MQQADPSFQLFSQISQRLHDDLVPMRFAVLVFNQIIPTAVGWIAVKCGSDVHGPLRIDCERRRVLVTQALDCDSLDGRPASSNTQT